MRLTNTRLGAVTGAVVAISGLAPQSALGQAMTVINRGGANLAACGSYFGGPLVEHQFATPVDVHDVLSISDPGPPFSNAEAIFSSTATPTSIQISVAGASQRGSPAATVRATADGRDFWEFTIAEPTCFTFRLSMRAESTRSPDQLQVYHLGGAGLIPSPGTPPDTFSGTFWAPGSLERFGTGTLMPGSYSLRLSGRADASTFPYDASYAHSVTLSLGPTAVLTGPESDRSCASGSAEFAVTATGGSLTYQWLVESPAGSGAYVGLTPGVFFEPSSGLMFDVTDETSPTLGVSSLELGTHPEAIRFAVRVTGGCGSKTSEPAEWVICAGDLNCDDLIDFADYLEFLSLLDAEDPRVDYTRDGAVDFADYLEFLNRFDQGC